MPERTVTLEVTRYRPEHERSPSVQLYSVPYREDWVILDALNHIKDGVDGTLSFRWSCRMGVCGSCGMMVNGVPKLTCAAFLRDYYPKAIRVEPLTNFPIVRDLVIDMSAFMEKLRRIKPWIIRETEKPLSEGEYLQTPEEHEAYKPFSMCINCVLCYAACPVYGLEPTFLGPAAIALAHRYNLDSRDEGSKVRQPIIASHDGIWECTFVGECSEVCP
ncbi:MAG: succinate dehydrogenase iron-sulfur subunit, partial [Nitrospinota bacterium]